MAVAKYKQVTYTLNRVNNGGTTQKTVYLRYILCNDLDITHRYIYNDSLYKSGYYGMNGTFFQLKTGIITSVAIADGEILHDHGGYNSNDPTGVKKQGTYAHLINVTGGVRCFSDLIGIYEGHVYNGVTMTVNNCHFAVGGVSLFPSDSELTESDYYSDISTEGEDGSFDPDNYRARSAIIYLGGAVAGLNTVLLTVTADAGTVVRDDVNNSILVRGVDDGVTLWELRQIVRNYFANMTPSGIVYHAIALDGGGSVTMSYKNENGRRETYAVGGTTGGWARELTSVLTVPTIEYEGDSI